jgi:hypothetical protein
MICLMFGLILFIYFLIHNIQKILNFLITNLTRSVICKNPFRDLLDHIQKVLKMVFKILIRNKIQSKRVKKTSENMK